MGILRIETHFHHPPPSLATCQGPFLLQQQHVCGALVHSLPELGVHAWGECARASCLSFKKEFLHNIGLQFARWKTEIHKVNRWFGESLESASPWDLFAPCCCTPIPPFSFWQFCGKGGVGKKQQREREEPNGANTDGGRKEVKQAKLEGFPKEAGWSHISDDDRLK